MKILYVITRAERGGAQVHLLDILTTLPSNVQPIVATGEKGFLCDECGRKGIDVRLLPGLIQPIRPVSDLRALVALLRLMRQEAPDVVHAHTSKAGLLARIAGKLTATPVVFTAHTWSFADGISAVQRYLAVPIERVAAAAGGVIITVSESNKQIALKKSVGKAGALIRIWNGIPDDGHRASPGSRDEITFVTVARFVPQKDHQLLLKALSTLGGNWRLVLAGDGPNRSEVETLVNELGLRDRVEFVGDRSDIAWLLSEADVFVLPSKWEGLPLSILEAMRAGLPVIATDVGGVAEAVTDGSNGFLTVRDDVEGMRDRIQQFMGNRALMREMGAAGRQRYERDFQLDTMLEKTLAVYRDVTRSAIPAVATREVSVR